MPKTVMRAGRGAVDGSGGGGLWSAGPGMVFLPSVHPSGRGEGRQRLFRPWRLNSMGEVALIRPV